MINLQRNVDFYNSYFNGFRDIAACESASQMLLGACKVFSYGTLIIPLLVSIQCYRAQGKLDGLRELNWKVLNFFQKPSEPKLLEQEFLRFLMAEMESRYYGDFDNAFSCLSSDNQKSFSSIAVEKGKFEEIAPHLVSNATTISLKLGSSKRSVEELACLIDALLKELPKMDQLERLDLSLPVAYTNDLEDLVSNFCEIPYDASAFAIDPAQYALAKLVQHLKNTDHLQQISLGLKKHTIIVRKEAEKDGFLCVPKNEESIYCLPIS